MTKPRTLLWQPDLRSRPGPRYRVLLDVLAEDVAGGRLHPGDRLPTHRDLARALGLGLGTVTRAYKEAEARGLLTSRVGRGTFVTERKQGNPLGLPDPSLVEMSVDLPVYAEDPDLASALQRIARRSGVQRLLQYQHQAGAARHRRAGAAWLERSSLEVGADQVIVCAGTHHALTVSLMAIAHPGDVVLCSALVYPGLRAIARSLDLRLHAVAALENGELDLDALAAACRRPRVRALYLCPSLHNPTTVQLSPEARLRVLELAREHDFLVLEDDVHRLLAETPPPSFARLAPDRCFHVSSFSKSVAAGLRVAFLVAPPAFGERVAEAVWASIWNVPPLSAEVAATWIEDGTADDVVRRKRAETGARQRRFAEILAEFRCWAQPHGTFAWLHLPDTWSSAEFTLEARHHGVAVTPSTAFLVDPEAPPAAVRVCLGAPQSREDVERGCEVLAEILRQGPARLSSRPTSIA